MSKALAAEFFGEAYEEWEAALNALHAFAQKSGAPAGENVTSWFDARMDAYVDFYRAKGSTPQPKANRNAG